MKKITVEIGFRSGNVLKIKCEDFSFKGKVGTENYTYTFKGLTPGTSFTLDMSQAEYIMVNP